MLDIPKLGACFIGRHISGGRRLKQVALGWAELVRCQHHSLCADDNKLCGIEIEADRAYHFSVIGQKISKISTLQNLRAARKDIVGEGGHEVDIDLTGGDFLSFKFVMMMEASVRVMGKLSAHALELLDIGILILLVLNHVLLVI